jgi:transcriptional regulator with GAF, ATPase, and Fis domain
MSLAQAKVLRALQENMITRVGAEKILKLMYELLLQTNKDLKQKLPRVVFVKIYTID